MCFLILSKMFTQLFVYLDLYSSFTGSILGYSVLTGSSKFVWPVLCWETSLAIFEAIDRSSAASIFSFSTSLRPQLKSVGVSGKFSLGECLGDSLAKRSASRSLEAPPNNLADLGVGGTKSKTRLKSTLKKQKNNMLLGQTNILY